MKSIALLTALAATLFTVPALADNTTPSDGTTAIVLASGFIVGSIGLGVAATSLASSHSNVAYPLEAGSIACGVIGLGVGALGLVQNAKYDSWVKNHPYVSGISVSPTSVGYRLSF